jgi:hypothetical protein
MAKQEKAKNKKAKGNKKPPAVAPSTVVAQPPVAEDDTFDFGGIPKEVNFKRNIGCGG